MCGGGAGGGGAGGGGGPAGRGAGASSNGNGGGGRAQRGGRLPDDALVVRGGENTAVRFRDGSGVKTDVNGALQGVSVNSAPGANVKTLSLSIPNAQIGVTTVGRIRQAGGDVIRSPRGEKVLTIVPWGG